MIRSPFKQYLLEETLLALSTYACYVNVYQWNLQMRVIWHQQRQRQRQRHQQQWTTINKWQLTNDKRPLSDQLFNREAWEATMGNGNSIMEACNREAAATELWLQCQIMTDIMLIKLASTARKVWRNNDGIAAQWRGSIGNSLCCVAVVTAKVNLAITGQKWSEKATINWISVKVQWPWHSNLRMDIRERSDRKGCNHWLSVVAQGQQQREDIGRKDYNQPGCQLLGYLQ